MSAVDDLSAHLDRYLELRRSVGFKLEEHARVLPDFVCYLRGRGETTVRTRSVLSWAAGASSERQVARRISMVRGFARYLVAFDPATEVPGRGLVSDAVVRSIPHIYTDAEISVLMELALTLRPEVFRCHHVDAHRAVGGHGTTPSGSVATRRRARGPDKAPAQRVAFEIRAEPTAPGAPKHRRGLDPILGPA